MTVDLSAIVIARNEEAHIAECLEACLGSIGEAQRKGLIGPAEVVLADSASADRTVEIAREFPITIVQLPAEWPLSAASGRFVGLRHARGGLLLFVDGDYVLAKDWLAEALRILGADARVAAVCGVDVEEVAGDSLLARRQREWLVALRGPPEAVPIGLYRRSAIEEVGGIHPFLRGGEDRDLAERLRASGWRLVRTDSTMGVHHWAEEGQMDYVTYFRSVLTWSLGDGQAYRARRGLPSVRSATRRRYANLRLLGNYLLGLALAIVLLLNVASAVLSLWFGIVTDLAVVATLLALKSGLRRTWSELAFELHVVPYAVVRHAGLIAGFLRRVPEPSHYPTGERILQEREPLA